MELSHSLPGASLAPKNWQFKRLGELAAFVTSGSRGWARFYAQAGALFIRSQNVRDGRLRFDDVQYVSPPAGAEGDRTKVKRHDLLITITGNSVGNVALVEEDFAEAYISQHVGLVRLKEPAAAPYICRYLSPCSPGNAQIFLSQSGQSKPGLNLQNLRDLLIASPPTARERDHIAETLTDMDTLLGALDRLIAKKRDLKQAAMQQLLTGQTRLPGSKGKWVEQTIGSIAPLQRGFDLPNAHLKPGIFPVVYSNGIISYHDNPMVRGPGIVTGRSGTIGRVNYIQNDFWPHNTTLWVKKFNGHDPKFLYYLYTHIDLSRFKSGSGVPTLNRNDVHSERVSFPLNVHEQRAIGAVLSDMDAELDALNQRRAKTALLQQGMMQELLTGRTRLV